jgi:hypothetical protein
MVSFPRSQNALHQAHALADQDSNRPACRHAVHLAQKLGGSQNSLTELYMDWPTREALVNEELQGRGELLDKMKSVFDSVEKLQQFRLDEAFAAPFCGMVLALGTIFTFGALQGKAKLAAILGLGACATIIAKISELAEETTTTKQAVYDAVDEAHLALAEAKPSRQRVF